MKCQSLDEEAGVEVQRLLICCYPAANHVYVQHNRDSIVINTRYKHPLNSRLLHAYSARIRTAPHPTSLSLSHSLSQPVYTVPDYLSTPFEFPGAQQNFPSPQLMTNQPNTELQHKHLLYPTTRTESNKSPLFKGNTRNLGQSTRNAIPPS